MAPKSVLKLRIKLEHFDESTNRLMIESVRIRPALWDHNRQKIPGIKKTQKRLLSEVATTLNCSVDLFKRKWKNLKTCFYRQVGKIPRSADKKYLSHPNALVTDWPYYQAMQFLIDPNDIHPSVLQVGRKIKSKVVKNEAKKRPNEESDAGSSVLLTESSSSNTVEVKRQRIEEYDAVESSSSDTIDLTDEVDEAIDLKSSQVSSSSNINDLSTGAIQNDDSYDSQNDAQNEYEVHEIEVTPDIQPVIHAGVLHIMIGLNKFVNTMTDMEKTHVATFLHAFAQNIMNGIQQSREN